MQSFKVGMIFRLIRPVVALHSMGSPAQSVTASCAPSFLICVTQGIPPVTNSGSLDMGHLGSTMLNEGERLELLELARRSIARGFDLRHLELPVADWSPALLEPRATFTTLMLAGELRGCCGTIEPQRALVQDVWHSAWSSAYSDTRFWPVSPREIHRLEISISVLTPLEPIAATNIAELVRCLRPGIDGLVLRCGTRQATFLPAVWKSLPDAAEFVEELKRKAGWSSSVWPSDMRAYRYRTDSFSSGAPDALAA